MKFLQKIKQTVSKDRETLKSLTFGKKIRFILDYYKGMFFILLVLGLAGFYCFDAFLTTQRDTVLEGFFTNDEQNLFPAKTIARDFGNTLNLAPGQQVLFDDSLYVKLGSSIDYHASSQSKIVAYVAARELDFLVTTEELTRYYSPSFSLYDLEELLPEDLFERLQGQLYYAVDGTGEEKACAVSLAGSRFYENADPGDTAAPHYLMVLSYTEHRDAMIQFLEYAFEPLIVRAKYPKVSMR